MRKALDFEALYFEWENNEATDTETGISINMGLNELKYFEDMTFREDSITHDFICEQFQNKETGELHEMGIDLERILDLSIRTYRVKVSKLRSCIGQCDYRKRIIKIHSDHADHQELLLHEMIHAYVEQLKNDKDYTHRWLRETLRDLLTFCLYKKLTPLIANLDDLILEHTHVMTQKAISEVGGAHGLLFLLKSFDLDLRLEIPLGSIRGYDNFGYIKG
jgi:hypothetical protein